MTSLTTAQARSYLRLLVFRHVSVLGGLAGFIGLAGDIQGPSRSVAGWLFITGLVGFALSVSVLTLVLSLVRPHRPSFTQLATTTNEVTGHELVPVALAATPWNKAPSAQALRRLAILEVGLFVTVPVVAVLSR